MSVILEFSIPSEEFTLGRVLSGPPRMHCELERIVPTGDMVMPFVWATGDDHEGFAESIRDNPVVKELLVLDTVGESGLYRIEWTEEPTDLIEGIATTDAVVLEAYGNENWNFRLRFPDHDALSEFHTYLLEHDIPCHIDRTYTLTETGKGGYRFDLSQEQREALVLALQRGYFATPSEMMLDELADELGITRQALSTRIRRGNEQVLRAVLLPSTSEFE
ncbi:bacterio-opsin activator domain-containing protein [Haloplanus aerogenes]|uniref:Bacterio-opsin activator n=1 Tax=Haloplanus aerogenes TaxID=660522 RepID=A0A3M0DAG7_9EURY|nr:bacterio-opsin activator domain-containing protein [Haloplanus aerogenes]AZH26194.1 bacterio-opsin activator [Haloplanus aerogenes]RMB18354.1 putative DNA binding protein [Haloplanus aerogenes]